VGETGFILLSDAYLKVTLLLISRGT